MPRLLGVSASQVGRLLAGAGWPTDERPPAGGLPRGRASFTRGVKPFLQLASLSLAALFGPSLAHAENAFYTERVAPIFDKHCVTCHGPEKAKGKLRVDTFERLRSGGDSGVVVKEGDAKGSELFHRITLPMDHEDVMPSDGKPLLSADEIKVIELWIAAGASPTAPVSAFPTAPAVKKKVETIALAPDWRPRAKEIAALEKETGLRLVPRSQLATDGLLVRTASAPSRCDDAVLAKLAPVRTLIVEAELARTKITDAGLKTLGTWENLREADLTKTKVTSAGMSELGGLKKLEVLNLTNTAVDAAGITTLKQLPALKHVWLFGTKAEPEAEKKVVAK
ncbi:MAG: c-type cytochrome domain-containing protein [Verrucomicrobiota bacterium]